MGDLLDTLLGVLIIIAADVVVVTLVGRLGTHSRGTGAKYEPFTGGEKQVPTRGTYQSSLFVFAVLFLVVEAFAILLSGAFYTPSPYYPLLFLAGGGSVMTVTVWWFLYVGGGDL